MKASETKFKSKAFKHSFYKFEFRPQISNFTNSNYLS